MPVGAVYESTTSSRAPLTAVEMLTPYVAFASAAARPPPLIWLPRSSVVAVVTPPLIVSEPLALARVAPRVTPPPTTTAADADAAHMRRVRLSLKFIWNIPFFDDPVLR